MLNKLGGNLSIFVQISLLNCADFPTSQPVKVGGKSLMKKGLSHAKKKKVVSLTTFDVRQLAAVKQFWFIFFFSTILEVILSKKSSMFATVLCAYNLDC